jgi:NAD(P)-dependent dehydrogenase (short-subunit alcohol dehydrogenase family)
MTVNARGTMLCYKYSGKQMIAQGRGGRIIGAMPSYTSPSLLLTRRRLGACSAAGKIGRLSLFCTTVTQLIHLLNAGAGIVPAYGASKFAVRGLTQAAGTSFAELSLSAFVD